MIPELQDYSDYCFRSSLLSTGLFLVGKKDEAKEIMKEMIDECRLDKWTGHRKSAVYMWSDSYGLTRWLYDHIGINLYKGLNNDQYRAYYMWLYLNNDWVGALKVLFGFIYRLGLTPSLMEWGPLKPQAFVLLFGVKPIKYFMYPIYLFCKLCFFISFINENSIPIENGTTNKVTMLPTARILGFKIPRMSYIKFVYYEYFKEDLYKVYWPLTQPEMWY
jgi:hypothetical protein